MTGRAWKSKALLGLAYTAPAAALVIYLSLVLFDIPNPFLPNSEAEHLDQHIHEGPTLLSEPGNAGIGTLAPHFELELEGGESLALPDLLEQGRPTFLYFWATT